MSSKAHESGTSSFDPNAPAAPDSGIFGLSCSLEEARVVLIPVPFEATTSYGGGTSRGPTAILEASRQVDLFDIQTGHPYRAGIVMLPESVDILAWAEEALALAGPVKEMGGASEREPELLEAVDRVNAFGVRLNETVRAEAAQLIRAGKIVGVVGGDHATPFGAIQAHAEAWPGLGVLHVDAHADLRQAYEGFEWSHASIMHNVVTRIPGVSRLVQVGIRDLCEEEHQQIEASGGRIVTFFDPELQWRKLGGEPWGALVQEIVAALPQQVYISFDIDGLDPLYCPHTGTPVPGGLSFAEAVFMIDAVARSGRQIVGFDLNEVAPGPEGDEWDGNVGARLLYKLIGFTLLSQGIGARPGPLDRSRPA